jgi:hypothetical protein
MRGCRPPDRSESRSQRFLKFPQAGSGASAGTSPAVGAAGAASAQGRWRRRRPVAWSSGRVDSIQKTGSLAAASGWRATGSAAGGSRSARWIGRYGPKSRGRGRAGRGPVDRTLWSEIARQGGDHEISRQRAASARERTAGALHSLALAATCQVAWRSQQRGKPSRAHGVVERGARFQRHRTFLAAGQKKPGPRRN